jgi:AraC-like DNA-binding protein
VDKEFIERIRKIVAENFHDEHFGLTDLCEKANMSRSQLFRKMKALIGTPPSDFIRKYRLEKAKKLLETTHLTAREVAFRTGYKDPGHFSKSFREEYHMHPSEAGKRSK